MWWVGAGWVSIPGGHPGGHRAAVAARVAAIASRAEAARSLAHQAEELRCALPGLTRVEWVPGAGSLRPDPQI